MIGGMIVKLTPLETRLNAPNPAWSIGPPLDLYWRLQPGGRPRHRNRDLQPQPARRCEPLGLQNRGSIRADAPD